MQIANSKIIVDLLTEMKSYNATGVANKRVMIKNISAWKISSLNEYSVQIRLGSNLGGFFLFQGEGIGDYQ